LLIQVVSLVFLSHALWQFKSYEKAGN
jgi:hypothetical protein